MDILEACLGRLRVLVKRAGLPEAPVAVSAGPLPPQEAIGSPRRRDFPLLRDREVMVEATFLRGRGQAFSTVPTRFAGPLAQVLELDLRSVAHRAIVTATMNAVLHHLGRISGTRHCRDQGPEICARRIAAQLQATRAAQRVGLVGYQPALLEYLVQTFGTEQVRVVDLAAENIGKTRFGVPIRDGAACTEDLVAWADTLLVTGSAVVNGTAGWILDTARHRGIEPIFYGVSIAGPAYLLGLQRFCPEGRN